jgi:hypothetical protein
MRHLSAIASEWRKVRLTWQEFVAVFRIYNRRAELRRLLEWASRKRLIRPHRLYQSRLLDEEQRLACYTVRSPNIVTYAYLLHKFIKVAFPPPRYYRKGSAAKYRRPDA